MFFLSMKISILNSTVTYFFSVSLQLDHILSPPPMPFRKSSSPEVSSGLGKSPKFKRQLSEDGRQLRRGSLGGALTGK